MSWSRQSAFRPGPGRSSSETPGGLRAVVDPTLPSTSRAVVGIDGRRLGVISREGSTFIGDWDESARYSCASAAVRGLEERGLDT